MAPIVFINKEKEKQVMWWEDDMQMGDLRIFKIGFIFEVKIVSQPQVPQGLEPTLTENVHFKLGS